MASTDTSKTTGMARESKNKQTNTSSPQTLAHAKTSTQTPTITMAGDDLGIIQEDPHAFRTHQLTGVRPFVVDQLPKRGLTAEQCVDAEGGTYIGHAKEVLGAQQCFGGETGDELRAVDESQTFFGTQLAGSHAELFEHLYSRLPLLCSWIPHVTFAQKGERQMGQRCQISGRAHTTLLGHLCHQTEVERLQHVRKCVRMNSASTARQHVQTQREEHACTMDGQTCSHSTCV
jgi:hypothetical protein